MERTKNERLWAHVHSLIILAQQGSYTAAAERLGMSKATISQRIQELERHLGVKLVHRTTRSLSLTDAGLQLVNHTQAAFQHISTEIKTIESRAQAPKGLVRLTGPVALIQQYLIPALPDFLTQYPDIRLELVAEDNILSLDAEGFDLALRHTQQPADNLVAWRLADTYPILIASPDYLSRYEPIKHPRQLADHQILHYPRQPHGQGQWRFSHRAAKAADHPNDTNPSDPSPSDPSAQLLSLSLPLQPRFAVNNSQMLSQMAQAGLGIAVVPDFSARAGLRAGSLVQVLPQWQVHGHFGTGIYAVRPYSAQIPRTVQVLVDFLRQLFEPAHFIA